MVESVAVAPAPPEGDRGAILWFGTNGSGATRYRLPPPGSQAAGLEQAWTTFTTEDELVANSITAIAVAPDGAVWFGTPEGVSRYVESQSGAQESGSWTTYGIAEGLADPDICSIAVAPDSSVWFGLEGGGVSRYVPAD